MGIRLALVLFCTTALAQAPQAVLNPPTNLTGASMSQTQINLSWSDTNTIESGEEVHMSTDGTTYALLASLPKNTLKYSATGLSSGTRYWFKVRAVNGQVVSAFSNISSVQTNGVPTSTPTPTPSPSPTGTPTASPTPTPTASPSPSPTSTPTPTATPSPSPSPTPTATPTPTPAKLTVTVAWQATAGDTYTILYGTDPNAYTQRDGGVAAFTGPMEINVSIPQGQKYYFSDVVTWKDGSQSAKLAPPITFP